MSCFLTSDEAANLGNFISGLATLVAVFIAWYQFKNWKSQEIVKRKAETAAKLLGCVLRFTEGLKYLTNSRMLSAENNENASTGDKVRNSYLIKLQSMQKDTQDLLVAWDEAEIYLSEEIVNNINLLWKLFKDIEVEATVMRPLMIDQRASGQELKDSFDKVHGKQTQQEIEKLCNDLKKQLKPIARME